MEVGKNVQIYCFKHDGSFHRLWENTILIEENEDYIVVGNVRAKVTESDGRFWEAKEPAITIFFKKEWYNVICMLRATGIHYYCNIASPSKEVNGEITYIDYDLDIGFSPDNNLRILDEGEYAKHKEMLKYPAALDYVLKEALYKVMSLCKQRSFPFEDEKINGYYDKFLKMTKKES